MDLEENNVNVEENKSIQKIEKRRKFPKMLIILAVFIIAGVLVYNFGILKSKSIKFVELLSKDQYVLDMASSRKKDFNKNGEKQYSLVIKNNLLSMFDSTFSLINGDLNIDVDVLKSGKNSYISGEISLGDIDLQSMEYVKENEKVALSIPNLYDGFFACNTKNLKEVCKKLEIYSGDDNMEISKQAKKISQKYGTLIAKNLEEYINVQKNKIAINDKNLDVKNYNLAMNQKELNMLFLKILETLKEDEETIDYIVYLMNESESISQIIDGEFTSEDFKEDIEKLYDDIEKNIENLEESGDIIIVNLSEYKGKNIKTEVLYSGDQMYKISFESISEKEKDYAKIKFEISEYVLEIGFIGNKLDDNYTSEITVGADDVSVSIAEFTIKNIENSEKEIKKIKDLDATFLDEVADEEIEKIKDEINGNMGFSDYDDSTTLYEEGEFKVSNPDEILKVLEIATQKYNSLNIDMTKEEATKLLGEPDVIFGTSPSEYLGWCLDEKDDVYLVSAALNDDIIYAVYNDITSSVDNNIQISLELETQIEDLSSLYEKIETGMKKEEVIAILGDKFVEMYKDVDKNVARKWYDKRENSLIIEFNADNEVSYIDAIVRDA